MSFVAGKSRTKVVREGNGFQARYYDEDMRLWFDLGDPRSTQVEADLLIEAFNKEKSTCRHCKREIVFDGSEGWIDPEAGYDDEDGDGIWRTTCDAHDSFDADHEPQED